METTTLADFKKVFKQRYSINDNTPVGRIDWAINDFLENGLYTAEVKELLFWASAEDVKSW